MADYIPQSDGDFDAWQMNFRNKLTASPATYGIDQATADQIKALSNAWDTKYDKSVSAQEAARAAVGEKDAARGAFIALIRPTVARIQVDPAVSDGSKQAAGLPIRSTSRSPNPPPDTRPLVDVDASQRLRHIVKFRDEATPRSTAKPHGVRACQVWVKVGGEPPKDASELTYLADDSRSPYLAEFEGEDGGKTAYYWLRWINTRGETGPWSEMTEATIQG